MLLIRTNVCLCVFGEGFSTRSSKQKEANGNHLTLLKWLLCAVKLVSQFDLSISEVLGGFAYHKKCPLLSHSSRSVRVLQQILTVIPKGLVTSSPMKTYILTQVCVLTRLCELIHISQSCFREKFTNNQ